MANNIIVAKNGSRVFDKVCIKLGWARGSIGGIKKVARWESAGAPSVDSASQDTYPVKTGDIAYDTTNAYAYICSVAPQTTTNATFVKMHA